MINDLSISQIVDRIYVHLPTMFGKRDESSILYNVINGIASIFQVNSNQIDLLYLNTSLAASGEYLDNYINALSNIGRKSGESDEDYRERYLRYTFQYNGTRSGLTLIVEDVMNETPTMLNQ